MVLSVLKGVAVEMVVLFLQKCLIVVTYYY